MLPPNVTRPALLLLVALFASLLAPAALAQDAEFPPFPVLISGSVTMDGVPLLAPASLIARIDDWESRPVAVREGRFGDPPGLPVIVGPPSGAYVGMEVTFHLTGALVAGELVARQRFIFQRLEEPAALDIELDFVGPPEAGAGAPNTAPTPTGGVVSDSIPTVRPPDDGNGDGGTTSVVLVVVLALAVLGGAALLARGAKRRR